MVLFLRLAAYGSVRRQRKVIDGRFAVDIMRNGRVVGAAPQLSELERFGLLAPTCRRRFAKALYPDDMRASWSAKKVPGGDSLIAKRCAVVHL
jgi:hypothetical protein